MDRRKQIQYAVCLSILAVAAYGCAIWTRIHGLWSCSGGSIGVADYILYYMLGALATSGQSHQVYDGAVQFAYQQQLLQPCALKQVFYCQYMPTVVPLVAIISKAPILPSFFLWSTAQLAALAATLAWFLRKTTDLTRRERAMFIIATIAALPCVDSFHIGQISALLTVGALVYVFGLMYRKAWAGIAMALLSIKIQFLFLLSLPAILEKRWRLVAAGAVSTAALLMVALSLIGWSNIVNYPSIVLAADQFKDTGVTPDRMTCIRGILSLLMDHGAAMKSSLVLFAVALVSAAVLWLKNPVRSELDLRWRIAAIFLAALLFSPHTHIHDCLLLAIPAALTVPSMLKNEPVSGDKTARLWLINMMLYPFASWLAFVPPFDVYGSIYTALTTVWLAFMLFLSLASCRATQTPSPS